jgi:hypothetical protein
VSAHGSTVEVDRDPLPRAGWRVVAAKELGDHLLSVRFIVLLIVLAEYRGPPR